VNRLELARKVVKKISQVEEEKGLRTAELRTQINWKQNGCFFLPPGFGKNLALVPSALGANGLEDGCIPPRLIVVVPAVNMAEGGRAALDHFYGEDVGGCITSQKVEPDEILYITTGIFRLWCFDQNSILYTEDCIVFIDECQRTMQEVMMRMLVTHLASAGTRVFFISATMDPRSISEKLEAKVYSAQDESERHEVEKEIVSRVDTAKYLKSNLFTLGNTLFLCSTRAEVMSLAQLAKNNEYSGSIITIMGGDNVDEKQSQLQQSATQSSNYLVFGTFGVANESVTYPCLDHVVIHDARQTAVWNEHGKRERWTIPLLKGDIRQGGFRCGRDRNGKITLLSDTRKKSVFEGCRYDDLGLITDCEPIFEEVLACFDLELDPQEIFAAMPRSSISNKRIEEIENELEAKGFLRRVEDCRRYEITDEGRLIVNNPADYWWSQLFIELDRDENLDQDQRNFLRFNFLLLASFGDSSLYQLRDFGFEAKGGDPLSDFYDPDSDLLTLRNILAEYRNVGGKGRRDGDDPQRAWAKAHGLMFQKLETVETLLQASCVHFGLDFPDEIPDLSENGKTLLLENLIRYGLKVDLFELFLLNKNDRGGWHEMRDCDGDERPRNFIVSRGFKLNLGAVAQPDPKKNFAAIVGSELWWSSRGGYPMGFVENATIIPTSILSEVIVEAKQEDWQKASFYPRKSRKGKTFWKKVGGYQNEEASLRDGEPQEGTQYWVSPTEADSGRYWIHFPVVL
jgi:UDP-2,3-diacylglucosamine pyrophosphatase LpxH/predicted transcriptional regulator